MKRFYLLLFCLSLIQCKKKYTDKRFTLLAKECSDCKQVLLIDQEGARADFYELDEDNDRWAKLLTRFKFKAGQTLDYSKPNEITSVITDDGKKWGDVQPIESEPHESKCTINNSIQFRTGDCDTLIRLLNKEKKPALFTAEKDSRP